MAKVKQPKFEVMLADLSKAIGQFRFDNRMTQIDLAKKAGVSTVLLANLETKQLKNISVDKLTAIANAIGCSVSINLKFE